MRDITLVTSLKLTYMLCLMVQLKLFYLLAVTALVFFDFPECFQIVLLEFLSGIANISKLGENARVRFLETLRTRVRPVELPVA